MDDKEDRTARLSPAEAFQLSWKLREREATPDEAKSLWRHFCLLVDQNEPVPPEILANVRDALRNHLDGNVGLPTAFGLTHPRGPRASDEEKQAIATSVLRRRLEGSTLRASASNRDGIGCQRPIEPRWRSRTTSSRFRGSEPPE